MSGRDSDLPQATDEQWPLGVCVLPDRLPNRARNVAYSRYILEVLGHAGVCHTAVAADELAEALPRLRLLLTVYDRDFPDELKQSLRRWVDGGGAWIGVGGDCGMPELFGVERVAPEHASWGGGVNTLGEGYLTPAEAMQVHPIVAHLDKPLHYFNGCTARALDTTVLAEGLDAHGRRQQRQVIFERRVGAGRCVLVCPDVTGTIVHIQQGRAVTRDGVPSADGTAPVTDGVLKSDDGLVLDWIFDRDAVAGAEGLKAFLRPAADQWRELLLRSIFYLAGKQDVALPLLWLWPRRLPAIAHLSHDTDGNDPAKAGRLLEVLAEAKVHSTWCVILPGYEQKVLTAIRSAGHELAMHYDAMTEGLAWSQEQFERQWRQLTDLFGEPPVSNKNHYLRWEGDCELFEWCERRGILLDQSKGASKSGAAGFNFGTCHPYFPVTFDGRMIDVLELTTPTQDLCVFAPEALCLPLLAAARRHHGVLHLLFHPGHILRSGVPEALAGAIRLAREQGMEWWTARQIGQWERARRAIRWSDYQDDGDSARVTLQAGAALGDATLLWLAPADGGDAGTTRMTAWGFDFEATRTTIPENGQFVFQTARRNSASTRRE